MKSVTLLLPVLLSVSFLKSMDEQRCTLFQTRMEYRGVPNIIDVLAASPEDQLVVGTNGAIKTWDLYENVFTQEFDVDDFILSAQACNENYLIIIDGDVGTALQVWNCATGKCVKEYKNFFQKSSAVACSRDGKLCFHANEDGDVLSIWDIEGGRCLRLINNHDDVASIALAFDSKQAAAGLRSSSCIRLFDVETGNKTIELQDDAGSFNFILAFAPEGTSIMAGSSEGDSLKVWDIRSTSLVQKIKTKRPVIALDYSSDGETVYYSQADGASIYSVDIKTGVTTTIPVMETKDCSLW